MNPVRREAPLSTRSFAPERDAALAAVAAIPGIVHEAVTRDPACVQAALDAIRA